jgi:aldose 1-epimerase
MRVEIEKHEPLSEYLGCKVEKVTLYNNKGFSVEILNYGLVMLSINVPDSEGALENVLMRYDDCLALVKNPLYLNATIGLNAGRIKNGLLTIDQQIYNVGINERISNLHGGYKGLHKVFWLLEKEDVLVDHCRVTFKTYHEHLSDGFPGNIEIKAEISLYDDGLIKVTYKARSDRNCHLNMTNHNYFNLSGNEKSEIDEHLLFVNAAFYSEIDEDGLPSGGIVPTKNSAFDFAKCKPIKLSYQSPTSGMDHPFILGRSLSEYEPDVVLIDSISKRKLEITTNQPCVVIYTCNKGYKKHGGICFEMQQFPNTVCVLEAGIEYLNETFYRFSVI